MKKPLILLMVFAMFLSLFSINYTQAQTVEPIVKVKLVNYLGNKTGIILKPNGDYLTSHENVVLKANNTYELKQVNGKLSLYKDGILLGSYDTFSAQPINSRTQLSINDRLYLGSFDFTVENNQYVRPINSVYMEDYLKGVVPIEMYPSWNIEALKTQAVAARTYAMSYINRGIINDTISYQVYGGYVWTPNTTKAVDETKGLVLQYNGRLIDAVYSASNGGVTESNANAWGNTAVPYLTIKEDSFDPKTVWNFSFNKNQIDLTGKDLSKPSDWWSTVKETDTTISNNIKIWLNNNGYTNKDIKIVSIPNFSLNGIGSGGRVSKGSITVDFLVKDKVDTDGKLIPQRISFTDTSASKVRTIIGNRTMLSYLVDEVKDVGNIISVKGRGDGHGVGMSQWGSKYMADAGKTYEAILKFYYTGISIVQMYEVSSKEESPSTIVEVKEVTTETTQNAVEVVQEPPLNVPVEDVSIEDKTAPIIKDVSNAYNNTTKKASITYSVNEDSIVTVYVKNTKGEIIQYLENKVNKTVGKYTTNWDVTSISNGTYTFGIIATDLNGNTSSAASNFVLNKPVVAPTPVKDKTAPIIKDVTNVYNNSTKKVSLTYSINEDSNVTIFVRNSKGEIIKNLQNSLKKTKGKYTITWDVASVANGSYSFGIAATDLSKNATSVSSKLTLNKTQTGKINASNILIKQKASNSAKTLGKLQKNQTVTILSKSGTWYYVQYGKIKGYVYYKYISNIK